MSWWCTRRTGGAGTARALLRGGRRRAAALLGARRRARRARLRRAERLRPGPGAVADAPPAGRRRCRRCPLPDGVTVRGVPARPRREGLAGGQLPGLRPPPRAGPLDRARPASCARPSRGSTRPASCSRSTSRTPLLGFHWTKVHPATATTRRSARSTCSGVDPGGHRRGLGAALTVAGLRHLPGTGPDAPRCCTWTSRTPAAVALYRRLGFDVHSDRRELPRRACDNADRGSRNGQLTLSRRSSRGADLFTLRSLSPGKPVTSHF